MNKDMNTSYPYNCEKCDRVSLTKKGFRSKKLCCSCHGKANYQKYKHVYQDYYNRDENRIRNLEMATKRYYDVVRPATIKAT